MDTAPKHALKPQLMSVCNTNEEAAREMISCLTPARAAIVLTCSGLSAEQRSRIERLCSLVGFEFSGDLRRNVTHILATRADTKKVLVGRRHGIWILRPAWLEECWAQRRRCPEMKHELEPLAGLKFSSAQLLDAEINRLNALVTKYGGQYVRNISTCSTHLVVHRASGRKVRYALRHGLIILSFCWVERCESEQRLVECEPYFITAADLADADFTQGSQGGPQPCAAEGFPGSPEFQLQTTNERIASLMGNAVLGPQPESDQLQGLGTYQVSTLLAEADIPPPLACAAVAAIGATSSQDHVPAGHQKNTEHWGTSMCSTLNNATVAVVDEPSSVNSSAANPVSAECSPPQDDDDAETFTSPLEDFHFFLFGLSEDQRYRARAWIRRSGGFLHIFWSPLITHVIAPSELAAELNPQVFDFFQWSWRSGVMWCSLQWLEVCVARQECIPPDFLSIASARVRDHAQAWSENAADSRASKSPRSLLPQTCSCFRGTCVSLIPLIRVQPALAASVAKQLRAAGAQVIDSVNNERRISVATTIDFAVSVHGDQFASKETRNAPLVTLEWVQDCLRDNTLHDYLTDPRYQPLPTRVPLEGLCGKTICVSGFFQSRRTSYGPGATFQMVLCRRTLEHLVRLLGATYSERLRHHHTDMLISESPQGKKYERAVLWNIPALRVQWLLDCVAAGRILPNDKYRWAAEATERVTGSECRRLSFSDTILGLKRMLDAEHDGRFAMQPNQGSVPISSAISARYEQTPQPGAQQETGAQITQVLHTSSHELRRSTCAVETCRDEVCDGIRTSVEHVPELSDAVHNDSAGQSLDPHSTMPSAQLRIEKESASQAESTVKPRDREASSAALANFFRNHLQKSMRRSCDTDSSDDDDYQALSGVSQVVVYHTGPDTTAWNSGSL